MDVLQSRALSSAAAVLVVLMLAVLGGCTSSAERRRPRRTAIPFSSTRRWHRRRLRRRRVRPLRAVHLHALDQSGRRRPAAGPAGRAAARRRLPVAWPRNERVHGRGAGPFTARSSHRPGVPTRNAAGTATRSGARRCGTGRGPLTAFASIIAGPARPDTVVHVLRRDRTTSGSAQGPPGNAHACVFASTRAAPAHSSSTLPTVHQFAGECRGGRTCPRQPLGRCPSPARSRRSRSTAGAGRVAECDRNRPHSPRTSRRSATVGTPVDRVEVTQVTQALLTDAAPLLVRTPQEIRAEIRRALEARREAVDEADADEVRRIDVHVATYHWLLGDTDVAPYTGRRVPVLTPATRASSSPRAVTTPAEHPPLRRPDASGPGGRFDAIGARPARRPAVGLLSAVSAAHDRRVLGRLPLLAVR